MMNSQNPSAPFTPLTAITVLDLSRLLPGPLAGRILADLGANVIKVEEPGVGDPVRWIFPTAKSKSPIFRALNRNKRSITLNLRHPQGAETLRRLARKADVLIESFRPGVITRLGLGPDAMRDMNPQLIYCSLTGFGTNGPLKAQAGHDITYGALTGLAGLNRDPSGTPVLPGLPLGDVAGGSYPAAMAILAALFARTTTGQGCFLDQSIYDGSLSLSLLAMAQMEEGKAMSVGDPMELTGMLPFYGIYRTKDDQFMALGALEDKFWRAFCQAAGRPDLADRQWEGEPLRRELNALFASRTRKQWQDQLATADACCEPILSVSEALNHPQAQARGMVWDDDDGRQLASPLGRPGPPQNHRPVPDLGQHTEEVLLEMGFSQEEIDTLRQDGAL